MRIGLISDTHIPSVIGGIPPQVREVFQGVDLILHAGDIYVSWVLDVLESIAPVLAARGDDDDGEILLDNRLKEKHSLTVKGIKLLLVHDIISYRLLQDQIRSWRWQPATEQYTKEWQGSVTDIFIFGHLHRPMIDYYEGFLLVSPGSPTLPNYQNKLGTVGLLTITSGKVEARIVQLG